MITSEELNLLIYRYLLESGFKHSAFTFANESLLTSALKTATTDVPCGALVTFIQKGLLFTQLEREVDEVSGVVQPIIKRNKTEQDASAISSEGVVVLKSSNHSAYWVSWNPLNSKMLASTSGGSHACLWSLNNNSNNYEMKQLDHSNENGQLYDITMVNWHPNGSLLATCGLDGHIRIFSAKSGELVKTLKKDDLAIYSIRFSHTGNFLLSAHHDASVCVWNVQDESKVVFEGAHKSEVLDASWMPQSEVNFSSCCKSGSVFAHELKDGKIVSSELTGHSGEVNCVKYSANGDRLASCSDDWTIRIWKEKESEFCLSGHMKEVCTIEWGNTGPGTLNPDKKRILASASFDSTVRIWDATDGACLFVLAKHIDAAVSLCFSNMGDVLVTAGYDKNVYFYKVDDGSLLKSIKATDAVYHMEYNASFDKLAVSEADGTILILNA